MYSPYSDIDSSEARMSSLDLNSSDNPFLTRSIHVPNQHFNQFNAQQQMERQHMHPFVSTSHPHFHPHPQKLSPTSAMPAAVPINKPASGLSLGLSAVAAQRHQMAGPFSPPLPPTTMQRAESVPSSCASSTSSFSSSPSPIHSTVTSGATSPHSRFDSPQHFNTATDANTHTDHAHQVSPPQCDVCPISLWYGCEDAYHARSVLQCYNKFLEVVTQRPVHSRAPLEFIGRVKREKLDLAKLHRVVDQYQSAQKKSSAANHRQRYASAADANTGIWRGCSSQNGRKSISSPCLASMNSPSSLACSPMDSIHHMPPSPLESLPPIDAFATLDLVSIYARDTLPLGLVFPLIRHEWLLTVWHVEDGIPENFVRIRTEYDAAEDADEDQADLDEEERQEEETSKKQLKLFVKCIVKSVLTMNGKKSSHQSSPTLDPAAALHASASSSSIASTASSTSTSTLASTTSTLSASTASPAVPPSSDPVVSTSYLYNFPIFSEDCNGAFDTFGSKANRPLGHLGQQQKPKQNDRKHKSSKNLHATPLSPLPSSLGYSGSQNDCIYDCLQALGRKVKCNSGNGGDDSCGEANTVNTELEQAAAAAAAVTATNTPASESPHTVSKECTSHAHSSDSDNNDDGEDDDPHTPSNEADDDLNDIGEDVEGFEFERKDGKIDENEDESASESESESESESDQSSSSDEDESDLDNDDDDDFTRPAAKTTSKAMAIQRPTAAGKSKPSKQRHHDSDDDEEDFDDDDDLGSSFGSSFTSASTSVAAGSLKDELSAQLAALNGGFKPKKK